MRSTNDPTPAQDLTTLLESAARGDRAAFDRAYSLVYRELRRVARAERRRWHGNATLNTTVLVHEAYLRLAGWEAAHWKGRAHFFAVAGKAMRQVLVNYAERWRAVKRGGDHERVPLTSAAAEINPLPAEIADEILALHEALERLERLDARQCRVVECRFFAGLSIEETAEAVGVSPATVKRDWRVARAWLYRELEGVVRPEAGGPGATPDDERSS